MTTGLLSTSSNTSAVHPHHPARHSLSGRSSVSLTCELFSNTLSQSVSQSVRPQNTNKLEIIILTIITQIFKTYKNSILIYMLLMHCLRQITSNEMISNVFSYLEISRKGCLLVLFLILIFIITVDCYELLKCLF